MQLPPVVLGITIRSRAFELTLCLTPGVSGSVVTSGVFKDDTEGPIEHPNAVVSQMHTVRCAFLCTREYVLGRRSRLLRGAGGRGRCGCHATSCDTRTRYSEVTMRARNDNAKPVMRRPSHKWMCIARTTRVPGLTCRMRCTNYATAVASWWTKFPPDISE